MDSSYGHTAAVRGAETSLLYTAPTVPPCVLLNNMSGSLTFSGTCLGDIFRSTEMATVLTPLIRLLSQNHLIQEFK